MITILLNKDRYLYDVHSLVKAFYQGDEVRADAVADIEDAVYQLENDDITIKSIRETTAGKTKITLYKLNNNDISIIIEYPEEEDGEELAEAAAEDATEPTAAVNESTNGSDASVTTPKNLLKQALYRLLCEECGRELPWGALTGIRPTKIATQMLTDGKDDNAIENYLKNVHLVSGEKARLSIEIAHREREVLSKRDYENGYSLYVGIPFCPTRCSYCSFAAYPLQQAGHPDATHHDRTEVLKTKYAAMTDKYLVCLEKELAATAKLMRGVRLDTVYIGGGTPTSLNVAQLTRLLKFLRATFDFSQVKEFTVEAGRPDSILDVIGKLLTLREYDVDRICVNPQTMHQRTLDAIGRAHTVEQTREAFHLARDAGFDNINMDIILGLPGEGPEDVAYTMREIAKLRPDDLTVHSLALKRGSRMWEQVGVVEPPASAADGSASLYCAGHSAEPNAHIASRNGAHDAHVSATRRTSRSAESMRPPGAAESAYGSLNAASMWKIAEEGAREMGLEPYYLYRQKNMTGNMENVGFARPGKEGLTNILGMEEVQSILACGAGAITKRVWNEPQGHPQHGLIKRAANVKELEAYLTRVDEMIKRKEELFSRRVPPPPASAR